MTGTDRKFNEINRFKKSHKNESSKVCITDSKEVLRITRKEASDFFFEWTDSNQNEVKKAKLQGLEVDEELMRVKKPTYKWFYTTKSIYRQYIDSLKPNSKIPKPVFTQETTIIKDGKEQKVSNIVNVFK